MHRYFENLEKEVSIAYGIAEKARAKGSDPELTPEIPPAKDLAERVEGLVGPKGSSERIRELTFKHSKEEAAILIAKEIVDGKFGSFVDIEEASEQALRTSLAILTEGIVAAPLEGIVKTKVKRNYDASSYLAIYFAGPIRSAGGSAQALAVLTGDYVRRTLGLDRYKPTDEEVERFVEEIDLYDMEAARLQYKPSPKEIRNAIRNIPVEVTGEQTDRVEVSGYRDLKRIETNSVRGGAMLVLGEGVLQKAPKILKYVETLELDGWEWLNDMVTSKTESKTETFEVTPSYKYIKDLIAGRPVLSHPSAKGGFRLRYGRSRNAGLASTSIHPATMAILDNFIAIGTQVKTERPGKGTAITPCDSIDGPIVKLKDGSVLRLYEDDKGLIEHVEEVLFLGDILVNYGEFLENNHVLMPSGYVEEWWVLELSKAMGDSKKFARFLDRIEIPTQDEALLISKELGIPMHPRYIYFYHDVDKEDLRALVSWFCTGEFAGDALVLDKSDDKRTLEEIGVPHRVKDGKIIIEECKVLLLTLGIADLNSDDFYSAYEKASDSMELVNSFGIKVREKALTYIGARMGRPEKAKERKMQPAVNTLFPIGQYGGRTRDVKKAAESEKISVEIVRRECPECKMVTHTTMCPRCKSTTVVRRQCSSCGRPSPDEVCRSCGGRVNHFEEREIEIKRLLSEAISNVGNTINDLKGIIGMTSACKIPEPLEKGILRARHGVYVFKDGTVRFDATDVPLTHFKPGEIGVSVEKLRELGYEEDYIGEPLENSEQVVELACQDIILSNAGAKYLLDASKFIDELLEKFYGLPAFYNAKTRDDMLGQLIIGLAPHTSAAVLGRIIGFTSACVGYAHPYFHAAKRRNCDGDEDTVILLLDALLNFSKSYLPATRGGKMDAPLVLTLKLDPREIDDEAHNIDIVDEYPLEFYESTLAYSKPHSVQKLIETVSDRIGKPEQYFDLLFTHDTTDISAGTKTSSYKTLGAMFEKVEHQLALAKKIRPVDERDVARRVIESHFLPDLAGNLRAFSKQKVRCVKCNAKYERVPLAGCCRKCGGGKLVLTVHKGSVEKYLNVTKSLIDEYALDDYLRQRIEILEMSISSVFDNDGVKQVSLSDFLGEG
jgi:DNA polymerase II large subunit